MLQVFAVPVTTPDGACELYAIFDKLGQSSDSVAQIVERKLGPDHRIAGALTLAQLGLGEWPRNFGGKILLAGLQKAILEYSAQKVKS